jgi:hypothetical protein
MGVALSKPNPIYYDNNYSAIQITHNLVMNAPNTLKSIVISPIS